MDRRTSGATRNSFYKQNIRLRKDRQIILRDSSGAFHAIHSQDLTLPIWCLSSQPIHMLKISNHALRSALISQGSPRGRSAGSALSLLPGQASLKLYQALQLTSSITIQLINNALMEKETLYGASGLRYRATTAFSFHFLAPSDVFLSFVSTCECFFFFFCIEFPRREETDFEYHT